MFNRLVSDNLCYYYKYYYFTMLITMHGDNSVELMQASVFDGVCKYVQKFIWIFNKFFRFYL